MLEEMRTCKKCGEVGPISDYIKYRWVKNGKITSTGIGHVCSVCRKIQLHNRRVKHRGDLPSKHKLWNYPLEERCFRNLRYLLEQYGLLETRPYRFRGAPVNAPEGIQGRVSRWIADGKTIQEITALLAGDDRDAELRVCRVCGIPRQLSEYRTYKAVSGNAVVVRHHRVCNDCHNAGRRIDYAKYHEYYRDYQNDWYAEHHKKQEQSPIEKQPSVPDAAMMIPSPIASPALKLNGVTAHLASDKQLAIRGVIYKRTLCGQLVKDNTVIVGSGDVTCKMCKKLSDKGE